MIPKSVWIIAEVDEDGSLHFDDFFAYDTYKEALAAAKFAMLCDRTEWPKYKPVKYVIGVDNAR